MNPDHQPKIALDGLVAGRLTFKDGDREIVYDSRGYQFANYPLTGDYLREKDHPDFHAKSPAEYVRDTGIFFGAYDDGWPKHFAFWEEDCFDPPQYLICAKSFEDAYDIFLEEFGTKVDLSDSDYDTKEKVDEAINNGEITYTGGGTLVHSESVNGRELKLVKIELVEER